MAKYKSGPQVQAAIRAKDRMDRLLDRGDFRGALGLKCSSWPQVGGIPRPSYCAKDGARVWSFGG